MSQLVFFFNWDLQMRVKGLHKSNFNISLVGTFLGGGLCASGWGNVNFFLKMCFWLKAFELKLAAGL